MCTISSKAVLEMKDWEKRKGERKRPNHDTRSEPRGERKDKGEKEGEGEEGGKGETESHTSLKLGWGQH